MNVEHADRASGENAGARKRRRPLSEAGHVVVVTARFPPAPGGSSVIMANLLSAFDPSSYTVATATNDGQAALAAPGEVRVERLASSVTFSKRLSKRWQRMQIPLAVRRLRRLVRRTDAALVVGVYPNYAFLRIAREAAQETGVPWVAYLHDTLAEGLSSGPLAARGARLQEQVFAEAAGLLVMSDGMRALYRHKYGLDCATLQHSYLEAIPPSPPTEPAERQAFWGGAVYDINKHAVGRVSEALARADGTPFHLATKRTPEQLAAVGLGGGHVRSSFYAERADYLRVLRRQGLLVLALDGPDESPVHQDELATIFPTKTPEYLASGRPILVHCPPHYFLARFFERHGCGLLVSERSIEALEKACRRLLAGGPAVEAMRRKALAAAHYFGIERVAGTFRDYLDHAAATNRAPAAVS